MEHHKALSSMGNHKKWLLSSLFICVIGAVILVVFVSHKDKHTFVQFQVSDVLMSDHSFHYTNAAIGSTISEVEQQQAISFPEIPYYCPEWTDGTLPDHPESVFDYRNRTDYSEAIEYTAYNGDDPVLIRYDDYAGHLGYQFEEGEMTTIIIRFAQTPAKRDPKMNYGGVKNDADLIYDQLYEELDFLLSAYDDIEKHESESDTIRTTSWSSNTEIQDGFITRLSLQEISDPHDPENKQTLLYIFRIKFENGIWTSRNH